MGCIESKCDSTKAKEHILHVKINVKFKNIACNLLKVKNLPYKKVLYGMFLFKILDIQRKHQFLVYECTNLKFFICISIQKLLRYTDS